MKNQDEINAMSVDPLMDEYEEDGDHIFDDKIVTARKTWQCMFCEQPIIPGQRHRYRRSVVGGDVFIVYRWCIPCLLKDEDEDADDDLDEENGGEL